MPESLATRCGSMSSSQQACTNAAEIESWPQPAHRVEILPFVVAPGEAELVGRQGGVVQLGLGEVGHAAAFPFFLARIGSTLSARTRSAIASMMKRAVIGVPS